MSSTATESLASFLEGSGHTTSSLWLHSPSPNPPLRIGLLLDGDQLPRFCRRIVAQIRASNFANVELLVYKKPILSHDTKKKSFLDRIRRHIFDRTLRRHLLYHVYAALDDRLGSDEHPRDLVDASSVLTNIDKIFVDPIRQGYSERFPDAVVREVRAKNLDVLIRFGFNILRGDVLKSARYGIWSYHHGDNDFYRGGPAHFWELYENNPLSGVILQVLTEELDDGLVLCKSLFNTQDTLRVSENSYGPYWGAADLIIRKLNELHRLGWPHLTSNAVSRSPYRGRRRLYRTPTNLETTTWLMRTLTRKGSKRLSRNFTLHHWRIAVRLNQPPLFAPECNGNLDGFQWLESPEGYFWADPFLIERDARRWVFFEEYSYTLKRGAIACAEVSSSGEFICVSKCLDDTEHHFSYPYVFRVADDFFMVPESSDSNCITLYQCEQFPDKWRRRSVLLRGRFVDPTIWWHNERWWLLATAADPDSRSSSLLLFSSQTLTDNWRPHPANPISTDVRNNRNAGRILHQHGKLIRPSQSCSPRYGYSFAFNEIVRLSDSEYQERLVCDFLPERLGVDATHTYNWVPGLEVIDGRKMRTRLHI